MYLRNLSKTIELHETADTVPMYKIVHQPSGAACSFEHNDSIVVAIEDYVKTHKRSLTLDKTKGRLVFPTSPDGSPSISLASFLFHCYSGKPLSEVRKAKVQHVGASFLPDGSEDCRRNNLVHMTGVQLTTSSRRFRTLSVCGKKLLELRMRSCTQPSLFAYDDRLLYLLANTDIFNNFSNNGRGYLQAQLRWSEHSKDKLPYISQIVSAVRKGLLTSDNAHNITTILDEMTDGGNLQVDHLFSDPFINCYTNLSLMTGRANDIKRGLTATFTAPYGTVWAYDWDSDVYLTEITIQQKENVSFIRVSCNGETEFLNWLEHLSNRNRLTSGLTGFVCGEEIERLIIPTPGIVAKKFISEHREKTGTINSFPRTPIDPPFYVSKSMQLLDDYKDHPETFISWQIISADMPASQSLSALCNNLGSPILPGTPVGFRVVKELSVAEAKEYRKKLKASAIR